MAVNEFFPLPEGAESHTEMVRYRTVGNATLTGAVSSQATDYNLVIEETSVSRITERGATRGDDRFSEAAMEIASGRGTSVRPSSCGSPPRARWTTASRPYRAAAARHESIFEDQLESIERPSEKRGDEQTDLALLTDGLRAEREQGITIDVAYRYFATPKRKFVIADTPGHIQYTRNMVTGASTANLALLLIDARKGVLEQTRRHALLSSMLGVPHLVLCVNKMDLVDYDQRIYDEIREEFTTFAAKLDISDLSFVPISALAGDNVVEPSPNMPWFHGQPLLGHLEDVHIASDRNLVDNRFPVQYVIRPQSAEYRDYRGFAGSVVGGIFKQGDEVMVMPSRKSSKIASIDTPEGAVAQAFPPMAVTLRLEDDVDVSRGDLICRPSEPADREPPLRGADLLVRRHLAPAHRHPVPAEAHDPLGRRRDRAAPLPARRRHAARATATPRRSRSTRSAASRSRPPRRSSSTPTGSTAPPAASSWSTRAPTSPSRRG